VKGDGRKGSFCPPSSCYGQSSPGRQVAVIGEMSLDAGLHPPFSASLTSSRASPLPGWASPLPLQPLGAGGERGEEAWRSQRSVYRGIVMVTSLTKQMAPLNDGHPNSSGKCVLISWLPVGSQVLAPGREKPSPAPGQSFGTGAHVAAAG